MKINRTLKILFGIAVTPWLLAALLFVTSPLRNYVDRTEPRQFTPPSDFNIVLSRNLFPFDEIFYQGDGRLIRLTTKRSPKEVRRLLEERLTSRNPTRRATKGDYELDKRDNAVKNLKWPSIPHGPWGDCLIIRNGGMTYSRFYIWPDGNGGTVLEVIEGFED